MEQLRIQGTDRPMVKLEQLRLCIPSRLLEYGKNFLIVENSRCKQVLKSWRTRAE